MKKSPRKLNLNKETLRTLAGRELGQIAGGGIRLVPIQTAVCPGLNMDATYATRSITDDLSQI